MFNFAKMYLIIALFVSVFINSTVNNVLAVVIDRDVNTSKVSTFRQSLEKKLEQRGLKINDICDESKPVEGRILRDYGAIFLVNENALAPPVCIFSDAEQVQNFRGKIEISAAEIEGVTIELQSAAMQDLIEARSEALKQNLNITPRDGAEAGSRNYDDSVRLWNSRFIPALKYWQRRNKLTANDVDQLISAPLQEQVDSVLKLEAKGIYFSKDFSKSIMYSVAPPGASQHLSLLAFDVNEYANEKVRRILARHGWFRTVKSDAPHFTYLGYLETDLPLLGLRKINTINGEFWIVNNF